MCLNGGFLVFADTHRLGLQALRLPSKPATRQRACPLPHGGTPITTTALGVANRHLESIRVRTGVRPADPIGTILVIADRIPTPGEIIEATLTGILLRGIVLRLLGIRTARLGIQEISHGTPGKVEILSVPGTSETRIMTRHGSVRIADNGQSINPVVRILGMVLTLSSKTLGLKIDRLNLYLVPRPSLWLSEAELLLRIPEGPRLRLLPRHDRVLPVRPSVVHPQALVVAMFAEKLRMTEPKVPKIASKLGIERDMLKSSN